MKQITLKDLDSRLKILESEREDRLNREKRNKEIVDMWNKIMANHQRRMGNPFAINPRSV